VTRRGLFGTIAAAVSALLVRKLPALPPVREVDLLERDISKAFINTAALPSPPPVSGELSVESLENALQTWRQFGLSVPVTPGYLVFSQAAAESHRRLQEVDEAALFNLES
jgi:hypothetical protein